jgi:hypothetical protein
MHTYTVTATDAAGHTVWTVTGWAATFRDAVQRAARAARQVRSGVDEWRWTSSRA